MITIKKHALVLHNREKMFNLVDRVEDYPNFLPWCNKTILIDWIEITEVRNPGPTNTKTLTSIS